MTLRKEIRLSAVGDVTIGRRVQWDPQGYAAALVRNADLAIANLEAPCSDRGTRTDKLMSLRSPAAAAAWTAEMGFGAVSVANNHAMDYGWEALSDTINGSRAAGMAVSGGGANLAEALAPAYIDIAQAGRVALVSLCSALPLGSAAAPDRPGAAPMRVMQAYMVDAALAEEQPGTGPYVKTWCVEEDVAQAEEVIRRARREADVVVVSIHWGVPPAWLMPCQQPLADYQRPLAKALIGAGADLIIGHHPHVLHGVELIDGKPCFYSLGNFAFHRLNELAGMERPAPPYKDMAYDTEFRENAVAVCHFGPDGFVKAEVHPIWLNDVVDPEQPDAATAERTLQRFKAMSAAFGTNVELQDGRAILRS